MNNFTEKHYYVEKDAVINNYGAIGCEEDISKLKEFLEDNNLACYVETVINGYELVGRNGLLKNEEKVLMKAIELFPDLSIYIYAVSNYEWFRYISESGKAYISTLCGRDWHSREDEGVWTEGFQVKEYAPKMYSIKHKKNELSEKQTEDYDIDILSVGVAKEQWRFKEIDGEYVITGYKGTESNVTIPKMIGEKKCCRNRKWNHR